MRRLCLTSLFISHVISNAGVYVENIYIITHFVTADAISDPNFWWEMLLFLGSLDLLPPSAARAVTLNLHTIDHFNPV